MKDRIALILMVLYPLAFGLGVIVEAITHDCPKEHPVRVTDIWFAADSTNSTRWADNPGRVDKGNYYFWAVDPGTGRACMIVFRMVEWE